MGNMAALPQLVSVEEFLQLPESGEYQYELHHGEVVRLTRPKARHWKLQQRLSRLLEARLAQFGEVAIEVLTGHSTNSNFAPRMSQAFRTPAGPASIRTTI